MLSYVVAKKNPESVIPLDSLMLVTPAERSAAEERAARRRTVALRGPVMTDGRSGLASESLDDPVTRARSPTVMSPPSGVTVEGPSQIERCLSDTAIQTESAVEVCLVSFFLG
jgi:hypothetical protein